ncbi:OmpP1/FadL family transporter [Winogradskyella poriferorum]|uniref:Aromatic hydrocarbon degradation protein n=1 Tax=Winogradskyella poriferorum TaxID=307627 RepID=A0ABU7W6H2_9FLAO
MKKIKSSILVIGLVFSVAINSQTNNLTSSPYSLFGLGVESSISSGRNTAMGNTGIALDASNGFNLYNPAAFASMLEDNFVLEFGVTSEMVNISNSDINESRNTYNFSNISVGYSRKKYGVGLTLKPSTNIGYELIGLENNIEGSNDTFSTNITGSGGINEMRLDYGYKLTDNLNLGARFSYLFGKVEETESIIAASNYLEIYDETYYSGARFGLGAQYNLSENHRFGLTLDFPTSLGAKQSSLVIKYNLESSSTLEDTTDERINSFDLPLQLGFGYSTKFNNILFTTDYNKRFWSNTNQTDAIGDYVDQDIFSLGVSYKINPKSRNYFERVDYRLGFNYNSGYLKIDDTKIDSFNTSLGLGLPLSKNSSLNFSYTYSNRGTTEDILVQERSNMFNINLTLSDLWFQKRKYN